MGQPLLALPPILLNYPDIVSWRLTPLGIFSVDSRRIMPYVGRSSVSWTFPLWKALLPLKIDIGVDSLDGNNAFHNIFWLVFAALEWTLWTHLLVSVRDIGVDPLDDAQQDVDWANVFTGSL